MRKLSLVFVMIVMAACQSKQKIMDVSLVSMTHSHIPVGMKLQEAGEVSGRFCPQGADRGSIGLFDQAVKSAQDKGGIDFISNASFWRDESGCVLLDGTGQKLLASNSSGPAAVEVAPPKLAPAKKTGN